VKSGFAFVVMACGVTAALALALSLTKHRVLARRLAQLSLWLTLAGLPIAFLGDAASAWLTADPPVATAVLLGQLVTQAKSSFVLVLPCAAMAGMALRKASAR
jgi:hypothetical protein